MYLTRLLPKCNFISNNCLFYAKVCFLFFFIIAQELIANFNLEIDLVSSLIQVFEYAEKYLKANDSVVFLNDKQMSRNFGETYIRMIES